MKKYGVLAAAAGSGRASIRTASSASAAACLDVDPTVISADFWLWLHALLLKRSPERQASSQINELSIRFEETMNEQSSAYRSDSARKIDISNREARSRVRTNKANADRFDWLTVKAGSRAKQKKEGHECSAATERAESIRT